MNKLNKELQHSIVIFQLNFSKMIIQLEKKHKNNSPIASAYLNDDVDVTDESQLDRFYEELFAYLGGRIHAGIYDELLRPMFRDYDAVKAAWYALVQRKR